MEEAGHAPHRRVLCPVECGRDVGRSGRRTGRAAAPATCTNIGTGAHYLYCDAATPRAAPHREPLSPAELDPPLPPGSDPCLSYDALTDRNTASDHLLATCGQEVVVLPQPLDRVVHDGHGCFVSAHRLRTEAVALGHVLRWRTRHSGPVEDSAFEHLTARIPGST